MKHSRRTNPLLFGLYLNAALMIALLVALLPRHEGPAMSSAAMAQQMGVAGDGSLIVVPAQFSASTWGCYIVDTEAQTLSAYHFQDRQLRLVASRHFRHDRRLHNFNTLPAPHEVADLVEKEQQSERVIPPPQQAPAPNTQEFAP
jgi:hypothetical protein